MNFSVLMSVYYKDNPQWLKQAIDSVLNNTIKSCGIGAQIGGWDGKAIVYNVVFDNNKLLDCGHGDGKAIEFSRCKKVTISSCKFDTNQNKWFEGSSMAHNIMKFNNSKLK